MIQPFKKLNLLVYFIILTAPINPYSYSLIGIERCYCGTWVENITPKKLIVGCDNGLIIAFSPYTSTSRIDEYTSTRSKLSKVENIIWHPGTNLIIASDEQFIRIFDHTDTSDNPTTLIGGYPNGARMGRISLGDTANGKHEVISVATWERLMVHRYNSPIVKLKDYTYTGIMWIKVVTWCVDQLVAIGDSYGNVKFFHLWTEIEQASMNVSIFPGTDILSIQKISGTTQVIVVTTWDVVILDYTTYSKVGVDMQASSRPYVAVHGQFGNDLVYVCDNDGECSAWIGSTGVLINTFSESLKYDYFMLVISEYGL